MKYAIASVVFWESIGFSTTNFRKSADGILAIIHYEKATKLGINLLANPNVTIYDETDPTFMTLIESEAWGGGGTNGFPDSYEFLTALNQFETDMNNSVAEKISKAMAMSIAFGG